MKQTKSGVSSLLKEDFGIEDFVAGNYTSHNSSAFGLEDVALANQLGLLASFKDYDTTSDTFSMEAYNLLGESDQIGLFAAQGMENAANQFSVLANIKKEFGVEGFDPLTYGAEGFTDTVKKAWSWLVAAFKKLIQSVSNFIRGVMNFVGGIVAKTQSGLVDKYKNIAPKDGDKTGKLIKAMKPKKGLAGIIANFNKNIASAVNSLNTDFEKIQKDSMIGTGATINNALNAETSKKISELLDARSEAGLEGANPSKRAKEIIFGSALVTQYYPAQLLSDGEWKIVLSKDFLGKMKEFVSDGKRLIKMFQTALKQIDAFQKQVVNVQYENIKERKGALDKKDKDGKKALSEEKKAVSKQMKATRDGIRKITLYRNLSGKLTGVLYGIYANCLKARSYYASAVRAYASAEKKGNSEKGKKNKTSDNEFKQRTGVNM